MSVQDLGFRVIIERETSRKIDTLSQPLKASSSITVSWGLPKTVLRWFHERSQ